MAYSVLNGQISTVMLQPSNESSNWTRTSQIMKTLNRDILYVDFQVRALLLLFDSTQNCKVYVKWIKKYLIRKFRKIQPLAIKHVSAKCQVEEQTEMTRISVLRTHLTRENLMRNGRRHKDNINTDIKLWDWGMALSWLQFSLLEDVHKNWDFYF
jgi:hypothetical protein